MNVTKQKSWHLRETKLRYLDVTFPKLEVDPTKRGILQKLALCYDPLGLASPILLGRKSIYREVCELGTRWDQQLPEAMLNKWNKWNNLPEKMVVPRTFRLPHEKIEAIDFHVFCDASIIGTAVALYANIYQPSGTSQGLVAAKSRLSKKNHTISRLELAAMHMAANLCKNIKDSLEEQLIRKFYGWSDSSVGLNWTRRVTYKQFVRNRYVKRILSTGDTFQQIETLLILVDEVAG